MSTYTTHNSLVPSFARVKAATDLARALLAVFPTPSIEASRLVSLMLGSVCKFFDDDESVPQLIEGHIDEVIQLGLSNCLMALASRVGVDLRSERWIGDAKSDARMMYTRVVFKLTSDLLDDTHSDLHSRIDWLQRSLLDTQCMLTWISDERLLDEVESAAHAYKVQGMPAVTFDEQEWVMRRRQMAYRRLMNTGVGLKSAIWGRKSSSKKGDGIEKDARAVGGLKVAASRMNGNGNESDSGVSMGGYTSESECEGSLWEADEIGVALWAPAQSFFFLPHF